MPGNGSFGAFFTRNSLDNPGNFFSVLLKIMSALMHILSENHYICRELPPVTRSILMTNAMKMKFALLTLVVAMLSSVSLLAQGQRDAYDYGNDRYDGQWPAGEGILYSYKDGLIIGTFSNGRAEGKCVCYLPNGEVYWGDFKKGKATGYGRIYRDNGIVMAGQYKNGRYHGIDTLYRSNGTMIIAKFRNGKLKTRIADSNTDPALQGGTKPEYPRVDLKRKQEDFLKEFLQPDLEAYDKNRRALYEGLIAAGYTVAKPDGAFYLFVKAPGGDAKAFSEKAKQLDLLIVPGDSFGCPGYFRLCYCVSYETIQNSLPLFAKLMQE